MWVKLVPEASLTLIPFINKNENNIISPTLERLNGDTVWASVTETLFVSEFIYFLNMRKCIYKIAK